MSKRLRSDSNIGPGKMRKQLPSPIEAGAQLKLSNLTTAELADWLEMYAARPDGLGMKPEQFYIREAARRIRALTYHYEELRALQADVVHRVKGAAVLLSETSTRNDRVDLAESIAGGVDQIRDYAEAVTRNAEHQIALKGSALARLEKAEAKIRALSEWRPAGEVPIPAKSVVIRYGNGWIKGWWSDGLWYRATPESPLIQSDVMGWCDCVPAWRELPEYKEGR